MRHFHRDRSGMHSVSGANHRTSTYFFFESYSFSALVSASLNAVRCVPPSVVYWPFTNSSTELSMTSFIRM